MKFFAAIVVGVFALLLDCSLQAQDTLPAFSVVNRNGKIILSWVNQFPVVKQMSIQRSFDSAKGFKTILTLPDPTSVTNGFLDNNAPDTVLFYKLYILLDSGKYIFSKAKRPEIKPMQAAVKPATPPPAKTPEEPKNTVKQTSTPPVLKQDEKPVAAPPPVAAAKTAVEAKPKDSVAANTTVAKVASTLPSTKPEEKPAEKISPPVVVEEPPAKKYALETTQTTIKKRSDGLKADSATITKPEVEVYKPSSYIFTNSDGNVTMVLPIGKTQEFSIKFFEEKGDMVFEIGSIKEYIVILDKSNFLHSGWFRFELYQNGVLKEKNKVQIPKDAVPR